MGVGVYSALGQADDEVLAILKAFGDALDRDADPLAVLPEHARPAGAIAVMQIRAFEARVGQRTGAGAERVRARGTMPIEFGNRTHAAFGPAHWNAAEVVARALADLLTALGATDVRFITVD